MADRVRVIEGSRSVPPAYDHPHASDKARTIAQDGMILRAQVGSGVHGTSVGGQDDRDEMGICLAPARFVTGLAQVSAGGSSIDFEQFQRHTVWDRPGGLANRSGAGDLDVVVYSARKWTRLALAGNPTVLLLLFVPDEEVMLRDEAGGELTDNAHRFVSRLAADRYLGHLRSHKDAMTGAAGAHSNRPELVVVRGYGTKFAMHALRLRIQGVKLLSTGRITLPVPEPDLSYLRAVRHGDVMLEDVTASVTRAEEQLVTLRPSSTLPDQPDRAWVDGWLHRSHVAYWSRTG